MCKVDEDGDLQYYSQSAQMRIDQLEIDLRDAKAALTRLCAQESIDTLLEDLNTICQEWDGYIYGLPLIEDAQPVAPFPRLRQAVRDWLNTGGEVL